MSSKKATGETFKDINVVIATGTFKVKEEKLNCKINYGMNTFVVSKLQLSWVVNTGNADNGFLNN